MHAIRADFLGDINRVVDNKRDVVTAADFF